MRHGNGKFGEIIVETIRKRRTLFMSLCVMVVFVTTYLLILPAITLDQDTAKDQGGIDLPKTEQVQDEDQAKAAEPDLEEADKAVSETQDVGGLSYEGKGYTIEAAFDAKAGLPEDTSLEAVEIKSNDEDYDAWRDEALKAVQEAKGGEQVADLKFAKFYDISLMADGQAIEPEAPVDISISYDKALKAADADYVRIVHFGTDDKGNLVPEVLDPKDVELEIKKGKMSGTAFAAESFSVYGVVYTVDFHWEVDGKKFDFSIPGGGFASFTGLVKELEIAEDDAAAFVANVEKVEFSDPDLVWVGKVDNDTTVGGLKESNKLKVEYSAELTEEQIAEINAQTVEAGDWALISMQPFDSEETLTVTMKNGEVFTLLVTDLNENPFGLDGKSFKIVNDSNAMTANVSNDVWQVGQMFNPTNNIGNGETWTFEYTGTETQFLLKDSQGRYLLMIPESVADSTPGLVEGLQMTTDRALAETYPVVVKETIDSNGKRGYGILDTSSTRCLSYYYGRFYLDDVDFESNKTQPRYCMELRDPSNTSKPGLINTADTKSEGITINLFDYYAISNGQDILDEEANRYYHANGNVGQWNQYNVGINAGHDLKFTSHGQSPNENNTTYNTSINSYADPALNSGNYVAVQGIVQSAIGSDGYPVLATNNHDSLNYLFNTSNIDGAKTVYPDLNHLFIKDENGYYRYNSNENYAYYTNANNNKDFTVYAGTFNEEGTTGNEAVGFFPFNDYDAYYNCIHGGYPGRHGSFQYYGPHNGWDSDKIGHYNHQFGMSLEANFIMTPDGKYLGDDIQFNFSGDDDLWVFVDGVLVLDIGGVHNPVTGKINFNTGEVTVTDEVHGTAPAQMVVNGGIAGPTSIKEAFERVTGKEWDDSPYTKHTLQVFYLERGGMYSNLAISFNLPTYKTITVEKELQGLTQTQLEHYNDEYYYYEVSINGEPYTGPYGVLTRPATQAEKDAWVPEYTTVNGERVYVGGHWTDPDHPNTETINKDGELVKWHVEVKNGIVRVKPGWYFTIEELTQTDTFSVKELYGYDSSFEFYDGQEDTPQTTNLMEPFLAPTAEYSYKDSDGQLHEETLPLTEVEYQDQSKSWGSNTKSLQYSDRVLFTNTLPTELNVEKVWTDDGQEGVDHSGQEIEYKIYRIPYQMIDNPAYNPDDPDNSEQKKRVDYPVEELVKTAAEQGSGKVYVSSMQGFTGVLKYKEDSETHQEDPEKSWKETVTGLPRVGKYTPAGQTEAIDVLYEYYVTEETNVPGYKYLIEGGVIESGEHEGEYSYIIKNEPLSPTDQFTQIDIEKEWLDANGNPETDPNLHKDDSIVFEVAQKKYKAMAAITEDGVTENIVLYPITINLYDEDGTPGNPRTADTVVVYVPKGASFDIKPIYNDTGNPDQHVVTKSGIDVKPGTNPRTRTINTPQAPSNTYYYPSFSGYDDLSFTIENVDSAKEVTLWLYAGHDVWVNLFDDNDPTNYLNKTEPGPESAYHKWTCQLHCSKGIIWDLEEVYYHIVEEKDAYSLEDNPSATAYPSYTMKLEQKDGGGYSTKMINGENAPGSSIGDPNHIWKGSIQNLPLYEFENADDGGTYIYTYEIVEKRIGSAEVKRLDTPVELGEGDNKIQYKYYSSSYYISWPDNTLFDATTTHSDGIKFTNRKLPTIKAMIHKVDKNNLNAQSFVPLSGAAFKLVKYNLTNGSWDKDTTWENQGEKPFAEESAGVFNLGDLKEGYYRIEETQFPAGYIKSGEDPMFQVKMDSTTGEMKAVLVRSSNPNIGQEIDSTSTEIVKIGHEIVDGNTIWTVTYGNTPGVALPSAGGPGTTWIYLIGCILLIGCSTLLIARRRTQRES